MKITKQKETNKNIDLLEFNNMYEFLEYIITTKHNGLSGFNGSNDSDYKFSKTYNFQEALDLLKNGWTEVAEELTNKINVNKKAIQVETRRKSIYDVQGFQSSVPRYLQGLPTNMVNVKNVPQKIRVVTINKSISYACNVSVNEIKEESLKALQMIQKIEAQGIRVNLNIIFGTKAKRRGTEYNIISKIRLKTSGEKLNISKVAFPLVHPSMLRRLIFRMMEVYPDTDESYTAAYGRPIYDYSKSLAKGEYVIPPIIGKDINIINSLDDLEEYKIK